MAYATRTLPKDIQADVEWISRYAKDKLPAVDALLKKNKELLLSNPLDAKALSGAETLTRIHELFSDLSRLNPKSPSFQSQLKKYYPGEVFGGDGKAKAEFAGFLSDLAKTIEYLNFHALGTEWSEQLDGLTSTGGVDVRMGSRVQKIATKYSLTPEERKDTLECLKAAVLLNSERIDALKRINETAKVVVTDEKGIPITEKGKRVERSLFTDSKDDKEAMDRFVSERSGVFNELASAYRALLGGDDLKAIGLIRSALRMDGEAEKYFDTQYGKRVEKYETSERSKLIKQYPAAKRVYYTVVQHDYLIDVGMAVLGGASALGKRAAISAGSRVAVQIASGATLGSGAFFFGRGAESVGMDLIMNRKLTTESFVGAAMMASIGLGGAVNLMKEAGAARFAMGMTAEASRYVVVSSMVIGEYSLIKEGLKYGWTPSQVQAAFTNAAFMAMPFVMPKNVITAKDRELAAQLYKANADKVLELYRKVGGSFESFNEFNGRVAAMFGPQTVIEMAGAGAMRIGVPLSLSSAAEGSNSPIEKEAIVRRAAKEEQFKKRLPELSRIRYPSLAKLTQAFLQHEQSEATVTLVLHSIGEFLSSAKAETISKDLVSKMDSMEQRLKLADSLGNMAFSLRHGVGSEKAFLGATSLLLKLSEKPDMMIRAAYRLRASILSRTDSKDALMSAVDLCEELIRRSNSSIDNVDPILNSLAFATSRFSKPKDALVAFKRLKSIYSSDDALELITRYGNIVRETKAQRLSLLKAENANETLKSMLTQMVDDLTSNDVAYMLRGMDRIERQLSYKDPDSFIAKMTSVASKLGLTRFGRYPYELMVRMLKTVDEKPTGPLAVMIYAKSDHNGSFYDDVETIREISKHYEVKIIEAGDLSEMKSRAEQMAKYGKADLVVIAGHGSPTDLQLGMGIAPNQFLDVTSDVEAFSAIGKIMKEGADVLLFSCSTGDPSANRSLAGEISRLTHAGRVFAPDEPASVNSVTIKTVKGITKVIGVNYSSKEIVYSKGQLKAIHPK